MGCERRRAQAACSDAETYLIWARLEPQKDQWNMQEFDDMLRLSQQHGLKILAFPNINHSPDWLKQTPDYQPVVDMLTGATYDFPSPGRPAPTPVSHISIAFSQSITTTGLTSSSTSLRSG